MEILHIFNPEHDIALASGLSNFTAPHAGRELRRDLGFLPALWATEGDRILVDDPEMAEKSWRRLSSRMVSLGVTVCSHKRNWEFPSGKLGASLKKTDRIEPWGWNEALRAALLRYGVEERLLPSVAELQAIRQLSHRREAAQWLSQLRIKGTQGQAFECRSAEEIAALQSRFGSLVLKAPWSSSGRGLRFVDAKTPIADACLSMLNPHLQGWLRNLLSQQGSVMVEPYYNKVKDFAMEFTTDGEGGVKYCGLSLFHTVNGAYVGNILASEKTKRKMISRYVPVGLIDDIREKICAVSSASLKGRYCGPFGIDMMVVGSADGFLLHPCVEINLRRTMGHVSLALSPDDDDILLSMRVGPRELTIDKMKILKQHNP